MGVARRALPVKAITGQLSKVRGVDRPVSSERGADKHISIIPVPKEL